MAAPTEPQTPAPTGPRTLASLVPILAGKILGGRRGLSLGTLLVEWPSIVGPRLAARTTPIKLAFPAGRKNNAVLYLRAWGGIAIEVQHDEPRIIERLNGFLGHAAIARLKLIQAPPTPPAGRSHKKRERVLTPGEERAVAAQVAMIQDEGLRETLIRLGCALRRQVGGTDPTSGR
ncbi:DUF721 domain-containing protein [uncultured Gammaproteobacteria bacterium]